MRSLVGISVSAKFTTCHSVTASALAKFQQWQKVIASLNFDCIDFDSLLTQRMLVHLLEILQSCSCIYNIIHSEEMVPFIADEQLRTCYKKI